MNLTRLGHNSRLQMWAHRGTVPADGVRAWRGGSFDFDIVIVYSIITAAFKKTILGWYRYCEIRNQ